MNDNNEWRIEELSEAEASELDVAKGNLASCQDDVPEGESGFGGPEGEDDVDPEMLGEEVPE